MSMEILRCLLLITGALIGLRCLLFAQAFGASVPDASVWVIGEADKVNPVTGNLLSEGLKVYHGLEPSKGKYRKQNNVWDAGTKTIKLFAGRNEFVSFQVVIEKGKQDLHKIFVNATDLLGSKQRIIADRHVRLFKQLYLAIHDDGIGANVFYPDALLPFDLAGTTPFDLPDAAGTVPGQKVQAIWVDIYVPHDLPPDTYTGKILLLHRNAMKIDILNVQLEVGDFTLPDELNLKCDLMNYGFLNIERGWPDIVLDSPRHWAIEREFYRMAHAHRATFNILPYNHDGSIPKGLKPPLAGAGETIRVADWTRWDQRFGPYLSGEAFRDLPRGAKPADVFFLPYNLMWPSDMRHWQKPTYRTEHQRISQQFARHLAERGWTRTHYLIYYNHKEHYDFYPWNLDEPTRPKDLDALRYLAETIKASFPAAGNPRVLLRLDIGHFLCRNVPGCKRKKPASERVLDALGELVDLWDIGYRHYRNNMPAVRDLKAKGATMYFYRPMAKVTEPLLEAVASGWAGYKYEADGITFWNATDWTDWDTDAPAQDPYTNAGGRYQGASLIFYPGSRFGYDGPIPSMRLKALRRGLQDFEYVYMLEKAGKMTREQLVRLADDLLLADSDEALAGDHPDYAKLRRVLFKKLTAR